MKVKVGRNRLILLIILIALFFTTVGFGVYWLFFRERTVSLETQDLDRYGEILKHCEVNGKGNSLVANCEGVIKDFWEDEEGQECFLIAFISKDYSLWDHNICEKKGFVSYKKDEVIDEKARWVAPVLISFRYSREVFTEAQHKLKHLEYSLMSEERIQQIISEPGPGGAQPAIFQIPNLRNSLFVNLIEKGYFDSSDIELSPGKVIKAVGLFSCKLLSANPLEGDILFQFECKLFENSHKIKVIAKKVYILDKNLKNGLLDSTKLKDYNLTGNFDLIFSYIEKGQQISTGEIGDFCNGDKIETDQSLEAFCANSLRVDYLIKEGIMIEDIEKYLKSTVESSSDESFVDFDSLILGSIYSRE